MLTRAEGRVAPRSEGWRAWMAEDGSLRVEFEAECLETLRFEASRAANGVAGMGMGGVLLGRRIGGGVKVAGWREIQCSHARGPAFLLSERDVSGVSALLDGASHAPGVDVVGWFATRARAGEALAMSGEDVEFQRRFFGEGGIVIVARADRQGDLEMALHRGTGESVKPEMMVRPTALERRSDLRKRAAAEAAPVTVEAAAGTGARGGRRWLWAGMAAAVAVCALAGWFWTRRAAEAAPVTVAGAATGKVETPMEMVSLHIEDVGARYRITWNGEAKVVLEAVKASLVIEDEGRVVRRELGTKAVRSGVQYYRSRGRRLKVALEMELRGGRRFREATVYGELRDEQMAEVRVGRVLEATN